MAVTDPYPGQPTDGQSLDAVPILAKFNALFQGIQSFDGSQIQAGTVAGSAMQSSVNPNTLLKEIESPFVATGLIWSSVSGLQGTMSSGIAYIANASATFRVSITGVGSYTFTASKDTYIDIDYNGNIYYQAVSNNAASPSITANAIRVAIVVTNGSAISFINQGQTDSTLSGFAPVISSVALTVSDSLGNLIYPTDPSGKLLGYRQITSNFSTASTTFVDVPGLTALNVVVPTNRKVKLNVKCSYVQNNTSGAYTVVAFVEATTVLDTAIMTAPSANGDVPLSLEKMLYPSAGAHTYKLQVCVGSGTATLQAGNTPGTGAPGPMAIKAEID